MMYDSAQYGKGYAQGRREALAEAAKFAENVADAMFTLAGNAESDAQRTSATVSAITARDIGTGLGMLK